MEPPDFLRRFYIDEYNDDKYYIWVLDPLGGPSRKIGRAYSLEEALYLIKKYELEKDKR